MGSHMVEKESLHNVKNIEAVVLTEKGTYKFQVLEIAAKLKDWETINALEVLKPNRIVRQTFIIKSSKMVSERASSS
ncbi:unnamed protein product [Dovyalis caffra]|uniref:Uncharacterized protein n=1 Tax=Dovyalis caffra TaxID=77055 RepID=A0AAV1QRQ3_9ROSI|nr:unnamed protein product [Dovyalis caffra]